MNDQVADVLTSVAPVSFPVQPPEPHHGREPAISPAHYETLSGHLSDGVAFLSGSGRILSWNESMARLTMLAANACIGTQWDSNRLNFAAGEPGESTDCPVTTCLDREMSTSRTMKIIRRGPRQPNGCRIHGPSDRLTDPPVARDVLVRVAPVGIENGGGAVVIVHDLSDQVKMQSQILSLHKRAMSDPLTGVANRTEFDQCLLRCTTEAQQQGATFSLIMCDIDRFKRINDVHGHLAGDEALIQFANVLTNQTRSTDLVARYGGEEFVVIAVNSDPPTAMRRANEIRNTVAGTPLKGLGGQCITVSIGVTGYQCGDTPETIVARADRALLNAKANGRNRVE